MPVLLEYVPGHDDTLVLDLVGAEAYQRIAMRTIDGRRTGDFDSQVRIVTRKCRLLKCDEPSTIRVSAPDGQIPIGGRDIWVCGAICNTNDTSQRVRD